MDNEKIKCDMKNCNNEALYRESFGNYCISCWKIIKGHYL